LIWQKTYDLATLAMALSSPARPFIMSISNFKDEDDFKI
jgi:hypothetical protein